VNRHSCCEGKRLTKQSAVAALPGCSSDVRASRVYRQLSDAATVPTISHRLCALAVVSPAGPSSDSPVPSQCCIIESIQAN